MADPVIISKIKLTEAMGVTENMSPEEVSDQWVAWSSSYPDEKNTLSPGVIIALDSLATVVTVYKTIKLVIETIRTAVLVAGKAVMAAQLMVPGLGSAAAAEQAMKEAMAVAKQQIDEAIAKMQQLPKTIYDQLTNTEVSEDSRI